MMMVVVGWPHGDDEDVAGPVDVELPCPDPEDLHEPGDVPPAELLAAADPATLPGEWVDAGMSAWFAHTNRAALEQARWILETSRARAGTHERAHGRPRAGKIVAASLGWSEFYATAQVEFARQILERLPALGAAMATGVLEERKAALFTTILADLDDTQARTVVDRVLPLAPRLPFQALRLKIEETAEAVDDEWAAARRAAAVARRRVSFRIAPSGAAELCGLDLPEDPAQDAHDRIVALGRVIARRLRSDGLDAPHGPIESEVMLTLTGPTGAGMFDADVVEHVVARFGGPSDDGPDDAGPDDAGPPDAEPGEGDGTADAAESARHPPPPAGDPDGRAPDDDATQAGGAPRAVAFVPRVALRIGLRTVLGLDRRPGLLPGRGPVTHDVAVSMAWQRTESLWRLLLYDPDGSLAHVLTLRPPRTGKASPHVARRRHQVVEVTARTTELDALADALADPARGDLPGPTPRETLVPGDALTLLERAARALAHARARPPDEHPAHTTAELGNRFPGAELRAWVQARDRTCRAPACTADAVGCDVDHTLPVVDGGRTEAGDLGPLCRRDHRFKHDPDSGWTVHQPSPGRFEWTSPTGRLHVREPERYDPLPDPVPRADGAPGSLPAALFAALPGIPRAGSPRRNRHGYLTDAARRTAAHLRARARDHEVATVPAPEPDTDPRHPEEPPF